MKDLDRGFHAVFGLQPGQTWYELMSRFDDANIYQALSYDLVRNGPRGVTHMVLLRNSSAVAAAQVRFRTLPGSRIGIAYVLWGPLWRLTGAEEDYVVFRQAARALRNELSLNRGLVVRLSLLAYRSLHDPLESILREEGYQPSGTRIRRTLRMDLSPSLDELRAALQRNWRNHLNSAEKKGLELECGEEASLFDEVAKMHTEMARRKGIGDDRDIAHLKAVQQDLPDRHKMRLVVCRQDGIPSAGGIFTAFGSMGVYLIGATSATAMKNKASYLVQWTFVKWLKEKGFHYYDLNGINPETQPGVYHFKYGLAGRCGMDLRDMGAFQTADSTLSSAVVRYGEKLISLRKRMAGAMLSVSSPKRGA